jgi:hypothetical protein
MKFTLSILCMFACSTSAFAQYGVSNERDGYGNLVRNNGVNQLRTSPQALRNNPNGPINNVPNSPPPTNPPRATPPGR